MAESPNSRARSSISSILVRSFAGVCLCLALGCLVCFWPFVVCTTMYKAYDRGSVVSTCYRGGYDAPTHVCCLRAVCGRAMHGYFRYGYSIHPWIQPFQQYCTYVLQKYCSCWAKTINMQYCNTSILQCSLLENTCIRKYPCIHASPGCAVVTCTFSISVHQVQDSGVYSTVLAPGKLGDMQVTRGIHTQYTQAAGIRSSVYTVSLTVIVQYHYKIHADCMVRYRIRCWSVRFGALETASKKSAGDLR